MADPRPKSDFIAVPGDKARRMVDTATGEVVSRRQYQQALSGTTLERAASEARLTGTTARGRTLYNSNVDAYAHRYNISRGDAIRSGEFKILHKDFRSELAKYGKWRDKLDHVPRKGEKSPNNKRLNELAKALGKKAREDFSDFGDTPRRT